jgi:hypothetical protein
MHTLQVFTIYQATLMGQPPFPPSNNVTQPCRSARATKKSTLFPGLVVTPSKAKLKQKQQRTTTPKTLKQVLTEAGLTDSLRQETVNAQTLSD